MRLCREMDLPNEGLNPISGFMDAEIIIFAALNASTDEESN